jgi:hypothetical protein
MRRRGLVVLAMLTVGAASCGGGGAGSDNGAIAGPPDVGSTGPTVPTAPTVPGTTGTTGATGVPGARIDLGSTGGPRLREVAIQGARGPLSWLVEIPSVPTTTSGARTVDAGLLRLGQGRVDAWRAAHPSPRRRTLSCQTDVLVDTRALLSVRMTCTAGGSPAGVATATFSEAGGERLVLGDVLGGTWPATLAAEARTQLVLGGATRAEADRVAAPTPASFSTWALEPTALDVTFVLRAGPVTITFPFDTLGRLVRRGGPVAS